MLERPEHFCVANCEHWVGKCGYVTTRRYWCSFVISQTLRRQDGEIDKIRIGDKWYDDDWNEIPSPHESGSPTGGCC